MKKVLAWGFARQTAEVVRYLKSEQICDVVYWMTEEAPDADSGVKPLFYGDLSFRPYRGCPPEIYEQVYSDILMYIDLMNRHNRFNQRTFHDYVNLFNLELDYFYQLLVDKEVEAVIFGSLPHEGPDWLLYSLVKAMGLPTILFHQMLFPNRYFFVYDLADYGYYNQVPATSPYEFIAIPKQYEKEVFYRQVPKKPYGLPQVASDMKRGRLNAFWVQRNIRRFQRHLQDLTVPDIDLNKPYVYFPLHLQPELTASTLGGIYNDQILTLERLSQLIPDDWYIYIKENPNQTERMRGDWFFERLKVMPKVKMAPVEMSTYALTRHCRFVATIAGTAGWEAISGGKNVLIFGQQWYMTLPGVFKYTPGFSLDELLSYEIAHEELEEALSQLMTKAGHGIVNEEYIQIYSEYDMHSNARNIGNLIRDHFIEHLEAGTKKTRSNYTANL